MGTGYFLLAVKIISSTSCLDMTAEFLIISQRFFYASKMKLGKKKCEVCKEVFQKTRPIQPVCLNYECAKTYLRQKQEQKLRKEKKEGLNKLKTSSVIKKEIQTDINHISRIIDKEKPCLMCGTPHFNNQFHGCHYHSVGSNSSLRFNLLNIWAGCSQCNNNKGGNIIGFDNKLIEVFSEDFWRYVKFDLVKEYPLLKLTDQELQDLKKKAREIKNRLLKENKVYTNEERITIREELNKEIGIYLK